MDKVEKIYLTKKIPKNDIQAFTFRTKRVKWIRESKDFSFSRSIVSLSVGWHLKTRSQYNEVLLPIIVEIRWVLVVVILKGLGNCKQKGWSFHHRSS